jgi:hypothetical protein
MDRLLHESKGIVKLKGARGYTLFLYTIIAGLNPILKPDGRLYNQVTGYKKWFEELLSVCVEEHPRFQDLKFATKLKYLSALVGRDINIFVRKDSNIYPYRVCYNFPDDTPVDILQVSEQDYRLIRNIGSVLRHRRGVGHNSSHLCRNCLNRFSSDSILKQHLQNCLNNITQEVTMPEPWNAKLAFKSFPKTYPCHFVVYADIECSISEDGLHTPISIAFYMWNDIHASSETQVFVGPNCIVQFLDMIVEWYDDISEFPKKPLIMTPETEQKFRTSLNCFICDRAFAELRPNEVKVRDHNHFTGLF